MAHISIGLYTIFSITENLRATNRPCVTKTMKHNLLPVVLLPLLLQSSAFQFPSKHALSTYPKSNTPCTKHKFALQSKTGEPSTGEGITIEQYSRCLSPSEEKQSIKKEETQYSIVDARPRWQRILGEQHVTIQTRIYFN